MLYNLICYCIDFELKTQVQNMLNATTKQA